MARPARLILAAALAAAACRGGTAEPKAQAPSEPVVADAGAAEDTGARSPFDPPAPRVVLDDPRFAGASALATAHDYAGAAKALAEAMAADAGGPADCCAASYVLGRLRALAGDDRGAADAFDAATGGGEAGAPCPLADYARLRAAEAWERAGGADEAVARASRVSPDIALASETQILLAEALAARGERGKAVPIWRTLLADHPHGARWVETAAHLASALLDGQDGDPKSRAREAFDLAERVVIEAPAHAEKLEADKLVARARALEPSLPRKDSPEDRARRARAWLDSGHAKEARAEAERVLLAAGKKTPELRCGLEDTRARAIGRLHGAAAAAWADVIKACKPAGDAAEGRALYAGAKASAAAHDTDTALARYAALEKAFPHDHLADDARLQAALIVQDKGDEAKAEKMLLALADDFPSGDMRSEALFRVALARMVAGDWAGATAPLDRAATLDADSHHWATGGRAAYFRARAAAMTGDAADAGRRYAAVVAGYPLSYFMAQAEARLAETDPKAAETALRDAMSREEPGALLDHDEAPTHRPEFVTATALLGVGEVDAARDEMTAADATVAGADDGLVFAVAELFDEAGAPDVGSALARRRLQAHLSHYPEGRWRRPWAAAYPRAFEPLVRQQASAQAVSPALLWGVMREESAFIAGIHSPAGAIGLMQLMPSTARLVARGTNLAHDQDGLETPTVSIALGAKLLASLRSSFSANPSLAIAAYNGGPGAVRSWLRARGTHDFDLWVEEIPYAETRGYIKRVLGSELTYAALYDPPSMTEVLHLPRRADGSAP